MSTTIDTRTHGIGPSSKTFSASRGLLRLLVHAISAHAAERRSSERSAKQGGSHKARIEDGPTARASAFEDGKAVGWIRSVPRAERAE